MNGHSIYRMNLQYPRVRLNAQQPWSWEDSRSALPSKITPWKPGFVKVERTYPIENMAGVA